MRVLGRLLAATLRRAWADRILGLAAEAGFWQLISLPSLLLAVLGVIGFFSGTISADDLDRLQQSIVDGLSKVVVPSAVHSTVEPALHQILFGGRADVVSIGFVVSLWTGSSAMATFVNTITLAYGMRHLRGAVRSRVIALGLYLGFVLVSVVLLPALVLGPAALERLGPAGIHHTLRLVVRIGFWPVVVLFAGVLLATLYHLAVPVRTPWYRAVPGTVLAGAVWFVGSIALREWLEFSIRRSSAYGPLGAPVAVLLFLYLVGLAVLLGAELNAEADRLWPRPETAQGREQAALIDSPTLF